MKPARTFTLLSFLALAACKTAESKPAPRPEPSAKLVEPTPAAVAGADAPTPEQAHDAVHGWLKLIHGQDMTGAKALMAEGFRYDFSVPHAPSCLLGFGATANAKELSDAATCIDEALRDDAARFLRALSVRAVTIAPPIDDAHVPAIDDVRALAASPDDAFVTLHDEGEGGSTWHLVAAVTLADGQPRIAGAWLNVEYPPDAPTTAQAKDAVRSWLAAITASDLAAIEAAMASGFRYHGYTSHAPSCTDGRVETSNAAQRTAAATCVRDAMGEGAAKLAKAMTSKSVTTSAPASVVDWISADELRALAAGPNDAYVTLRAADAGYADWDLIATVAVIDAEAFITGAYLGAQLIDD